MEPAARRQSRSRQLVAAFLRDPGSGRVYRRGKLIGQVGSSHPDGVPREGPGGPKGSRPGRSAVGPGVRAVTRAECGAPVRLASSLRTSRVPESLESSAAFAWLGVRGWVAGSHVWGAISACVCVCARVTRAPRFFVGPSRCVCLSRVCPLQLCVLCWSFVWNTHGPGCVLCPDPPVSRGILCPAPAPIPMLLPLGLARSPCLSRVPGRFSSSHRGLCNRAPVE